MSDPFLLALRVRYGECDAQQVVFNSRYGDYADIAATEYFRVLFGGIQELLKQGLDTQVVRYAIDWKSPARFDDVLGARVQTLRVGNTSFALQVDFLEYFSQRPIAACELTYVLVSASEHRKTQITESFRQTLLPGAPGVVVNQSGADLNV